MAEPLSLADRFMALSPDQLESAKFKQPGVSEQPIEAQPTAGSDLASRFMAMSPEEAGIAPTESEAAFLEGSLTGRAEAAKRAREATFAESERLGVPLVRRPEVPAVDIGTRARLSFLTDIQDQVNELNQLIEDDPNLGGQRARYDENVGLVIPRFNATSGQVEDVVVDPKGTEGDLVGDIADVLGTIGAEALTAMSGLGAVKLASKLGGALRGIGLLDKAAKATPSFVGTGAQIGAMSTGTAAGRQAIEAGFRGFELPQDGGFGESKSRFQQEALLDLGLSSAIGALGWASTPWTRGYKSSPEVKKYRSMVDKLNTDLNLKGASRIQPSLGEITGMENLIKLEQFSGKQLFVGPKLRELKRQRDRALLEVSNSILEKYGVSVPDQQLSLDLGPNEMLLDKLRNAQTISMDEQETLINALQKDFNQKYNQLSGPARFQNIGSAGEQVRLDLESRLESFRQAAKLDYDKVADSINQAKLDYGDSVEFDFLVKLDDPSKTLKELYSKATYWKKEVKNETKRVRAKSGIGFEDEEVAEETIKRYRESRLIPATIRKYTQFIENVAKDGAPLEYMESMRRQMTDDIAKLGGFTGNIATDEARILRNLVKDVDTAVEKAIETIPNQNIVDTIKTARANYNANRDKFKIPVVRKLLDNTAEGKVSNYSVLKEILRTDESYEGFKSLFAGDPDTWNSFRRPFLDAIADGALVGEGQVGISKFIRQLDKAPESVKVDLLGPDYREVVNFFREAERIAPSGGTRLNVDPGLIDRFIQSGYSQESKDALKAAVSASDGVIQEAQNQLSKKLGTPLSKDLIERGEFVSTLVDDATPTQAKNIAKRAGTGKVQETFRRKVLEHFFTKTNTSQTLKLALEDTARAYKTGLVGDVFRRELTKNEIAYRTYLGDEIFDILEAFTVVNEYGDAMLKRVGVDVGAFSAGSNINKLLTSPGETKLGDSLAGYTGYAVVAGLLTVPGVRRWLMAEPISRKRMMQVIAGAELTPEGNLGPSLLGQLNSMFDNPETAAATTAAILSEALPDESSDLGASMSEDMIEPQPQPAQQ